MEQLEWFAGRLKELRIAARMTQQQLADKAGMKLGGVTFLEQGLRSPTWESVLALSNALGVECTAFTEPPADRPAPGRGRPTREPKATKKKGKK